MRKVAQELPADFELTANMVAAPEAVGWDKAQQKKEVGYFVPPNPKRMMDPRPNRAQVTQSNDCYVDPNGLMYLTDQNAGLYILQYEGQL